MDGKKEKGLERKAWAASQTTARMTFVDVMFWLGTRISYSLSVISSSDTLFSSRGTGHQWPPNTAKHHLLGLSLHLFIYPSTQLSSLYHLSLSSINVSIYVSLISIICLYQLSIHPSIYLSSLYLTISICYQCVYLPIYLCTQVSIIYHSPSVLIFFIPFLV